MRQIHIQRPSPTYKACVAITRISSYFEYPKHMEKFIWGIPCKYNNILDQEVSALCSCWIYDGSRQSLKVAKVVDSWFNKSPFKFLANKEYNDWLLNNNQESVVYERITIKDCYVFFCKLREIIGSYKGIKNALRLIDLPSYTDRLRYILKDIPRFSNGSTDAEGRLNLFFFIMEHCLDQYGLNQSTLKAPLFEKSILPNCRELKILKKEEDDAVDLVTSHLKWFSEKYPMTFWVGLASYKEYARCEPNLSKKLSKMRLAKHRFKKRH